MQYGYHIFTASSITLFHLSNVIYKRTQFSVVVLSQRLCRKIALAAKDDSTHKIITLPSIEHIERQSGSSAVVREQNRRKKKFRNKQL